MQDICIGVLVRGWTQVTSLLVVVVASRMLDRQDFGTYAVASVFVIALTTVMYSGLYEYLIKVEKCDSASDTCFWLNLAFSLCGVTFIYAVSPLVAYLTRTPDVSSLMVVLAPSALVAALTSWQEALVLRHKSVTSYYIVWYLSETISAALAIGMFLDGVGVRSLVAYRYSQLAVSSLGYVIHTGTLPRLAWRTREARLALAFASRLYGSRLIGIMASYSPDLIIGWLVSPAAAGAYRLASRMVFGVSEIWFQPIKTIAWIRFSSAVRTAGRVGDDWPPLMAVLSIVAWPALGAVALLSSQLTDIVLGRQWEAVSPIVVILAVAKSAEVFEVFLDPMLATLGDMRRLLMIRVAAAGAVMTGLLLLAPLGPTAAAWAQAGTSIMLAALAIRIGMTLTHLRGGRVTAALLPGMATALCTMSGVAVTAHCVSGTRLSQLGQLACATGGGGAAYVFMTAIVFKHKIKEVASYLKARSQRMRIRPADAV